MSKKPGELETSALTAWTPAQQAALYQLHISKQAEADEEEEDRKEEEKTRRRLAGLPEVEPEKAKPDRVAAADIVDDLLGQWCPPLYRFLGIFAPPHRALAVFVALHILYWVMVPWYLRYLLTFPLIYLIPITCTLIEVYTDQNRALWMSYWVELATLEYVELVVFGDTARSLVWWPKMKALFCVLLYSVVETHEDSTKREKITTKVFGAIKLIKPFLPEDPAEVEKKNREKEKIQEKKKEAVKDKTKIEKGRGEA